MNFRPLFLSSLLVLLASLSFAQSPYPCKTSPCISASSQGWIPGEIRAFAFGADSQNVVDELARLGWIECAGQSAIRKDFDALWRVIGAEWGAADKTNVFFLPDLRGLFLRGWQHDRKAPVNHSAPPFSGDNDVAARVDPRPEAGEAGGIPGSGISNHVGSLQGEAFLTHTHALGFPPIPAHPGGQAFQPAYSNQAPTYHGHVEGQNAPVPATTQAAGGNETHPSNAAVMYFIYVGRPATIIPATAASPARIVRAKQRKAGH